MGSFKEFDKKAPPPGAELGGQAQNERKNDEETGEPVQLPDDKSKQGRGKRGMNKQGGSQQGGQEQGAAH